MPIGDRINECKFNSSFNNKDIISILDNVDENFTSIDGRSMPSNDMVKDILAKEENTTTNNMVVNGNFHAILKPGERVTVKKEKIYNNIENIFENYSQNAEEYATIISREIAPPKDAENYNDIWFMKLNKEYQLSLYKLQQMEIDLNNKNREIDKLKLDKQYMEGVFSLLKPKSIKLIPNSILAYMLVIAMAFCFFLTCFALDMFTIINIMHPFISFILAIGSLGLLLTSFSSVEDIKNNFFQNLESKGK